jgi:hypothetical protein
MRVFKILEKLLALLVVAPPIYMAFRYIRWFYRHNREVPETEQ